MCTMEVLMSGSQSRLDCSACCRRYIRLYALPRSTFEPTFANFSFSFCDAKAPSIRSIRHSICTTHVQCGFLLSLGDRVSQNWLSNGKTFEPPNFARHKIRQMLLPVSISMLFIGCRLCKGLHCCSTCSIYCPQPHVR